MPEIPPPITMTEGGEAFCPSIILIGDAPPAAKPLEGWSIILPIRVAFDGDEVEKIESNRIEAERESGIRECGGEARSANN
ncbi:Os04g0671500 [Oryza sativa Japonica Group]|uniref:Os04g0671500 protein n=1 Tax=Oryza sativa subsp. japonica TaxID=39947 RepID=A0A0P0WG39_ORYSJ|nr:hypothetical protein EE612_026191 [Oryza sativa]BAS91568.1 Os04g0671500 [Oryza sativa Japonica Group]